MTVFTGFTTTGRPTADESWGSLLPDDLDADLAAARAVELGEDHGLEPPERQLAVVHTEGDAAPEERGAQVRVRVAALAVRHARVVVTVAVALGDEPLDERLEVVDERALELVDEQRAGRVESVDERDARPDGRLLHRVPHQLRDVGNLGALLTRQRERGGENLHVCLLSEAHAAGFAPRPTDTITTHRGKSQPLA